MEKIFEKPNIEIFKEIEGTGNVYPYTDVSLLHERRILHYPTTYNRLFAFNVDTRTNTEINVGRRVHGVASLTGIDCGAKTVFNSNDYWIYTLNVDDTVAQVVGKQYGTLAALFPSTSSPKSVKDAVFMYGECFMKDGKWINTYQPIKFYGRSIVRVYRDIFLAYDYKTRSWVLVRILVP